MSRDAYTHARDADRALDSLDAACRDALHAVRIALDAVASEAPSAAEDALRDAEKVLVPADEQIDAVREAVDELERVARDKEDEAESAGERADEHRALLIELRDSLALLTEAAQGLLDTADRRHDPVRGELLRWDRWKLEAALRRADAAVRDAADACNEAAAEARAS
jgi:chromosome segregation ATPase